MKIFRTTSLLLFALLLSLNACSRRQAAPGEIRFRLPTDPPTLDWTLATDNVSKEVIDALHEGLVEADANAKIQPAMAESWEISKDGKTYTFKLRDGLKWSDGQPVVAQQFVDSWERLLNPKTASEYAYFLFDLVGAEDYQKGALKDFAKVGVKAPDSKTLVVSLRTPVAYWIDIPTFWVTYPLRKDVVEKYGDRWTDPEHIVSAGAYALKELERDSKIVLEKNPYSWHDMKGAPTRVVFRIVKDDSTAVSLFNNHDLDIVRDLPSIQLNELSKRPEFLSSPFLRGYYIGFNIKEAKVADPRIRRALALAIDRNEVQKVVGKALANPTNSWIPPGLLAYNPDRGIAYNPTEAKKLWSEIKSKPSDVELWFDQNELNRLVAENVQNQWKRALGLDAKLTNQEWKVYLKTLHTKPPAVFRMGWGADYPDPDTFMNLFTCQSGNNNTKMCNPRYDALIKQAASSSSEEARKKAYDEAQKILLEDEIAIIPLFTQTNMHLVSQRVKGFRVNPMGDYLIREIRLK
jgi:oligopeptide transport system substrate-binding protein